MKNMYVNAENLQTRIALTTDGRIEEYYIERQDSRRIVGSIYKGRIRNLEPSLQAAFVDIGLEKNAFLHYWDMIPATKELFEDDIDEDDAVGVLQVSDDEALEDISEDQPSDNKNRSQGRRNSRGRRGRGRRGGRRNDDRSSGSDSGNGGDQNGGNQGGDNAPYDGKASFTSSIKKFFTSKLFPRDTESEAPQKDEGGKKPKKRRRRGGRRGGGGDKNEAQQQDSGRGKPKNDRSRGGSKNNRNRGGGGGGRQNNRRHQRKPFDLDEIPKRFEVNSEVVVQVSKGMIGDKGPRVTTNLSIPGRYIVLLPNSEHRGVSRRIEDRRERGRLRQVIQSVNLPKNMGLICRTAAEGLPDDVLRDDINHTLDKWKAAEGLKRRRAPICIYQEPGLLERCLRDFLCEQVDEIVVDSQEAYKTTLHHVKRLDKDHRPRVKYYDDPKPLFESFKLNEQINNLFRRKITLPSGAEVCFDETEALIAIDINSGKSRGGKDHPETILNTNLEAAEEIGRQLKIRNVGGLVVIDFIDMRSRKDQQKVYRKMRDVLARDRAKSKILPLSRLGLMQMTRQREHASLQNAVYESCHYCAGRGLVKSSTTISVEIQRRLQEILRRDSGRRTPIRVTVHPRVLQRLKNEDAGVLEEMEREFGGDLSFRADPEVHQEDFHLINSTTGKEL